MRHHNVIRKFGRVRKIRKALLASLASSLIINGAITTTQAKAKELRPLVEKLITKAREQTLEAMRALPRQLRSQKAVSKLVDNVAPKYKNRNGGYTRIIKLGQRKSDGGALARIELV